MVMHLQQRLANCYVADIVSNDGPVAHNFCVEQRAPVLLGGEAFAETHLCIGWKGCRTDWYTRFVYRVFTMVPECAVVAHNELLPVVDGAFSMSIRRLTTVVKSRAHELGLIVPGKLPNAALEGSWRCGGQRLWRV